MSTLSSKVNRGSLTADKVTAGCVTPTSGYRGMMAAAKAVGMSKEQMLNAIRVARIPKDVFERLIESDNPATVTKLAKMGMKKLRYHEPNPHSQRMRRFKELWLDMPIEQQREFLAWTKELPL